MTTLQACRDRYANFVAGGAEGADARLVRAFAAVPREDFVGPGPWAIFDGSGYRPTFSDDPRLLYQDVLVGLATERGINNGQPSLHARCLAACAPRAGDAVLHIGAGTGYYTAILVTLVGPGGKVVAYEIEADLAERARANLRRWPRVEVVAASAAEGPLPPSDVIYVNAGATHPPASWLDALKPGGRLIFPLTTDDGRGAMLLVTRRTAEHYAAAVVSRVAFIPCVGARDAEASMALALALRSRSIEDVRSLHRGTPPDGTAWCVGRGWWLSTAQP
jgi:protein-L-isoaspartate(D-aspartate) O-methyltransferase